VLLRLAHHVRMRKRYFCLITSYCQSGYMEYDGWQAGWAVRVVRLLHSTMG
jgi:hypothetical protein